MPTIYRASYLSALKALSRAENPEPLVRTLDFAQKWVAAIGWSTLEDTRSVLGRCHAFMDSDEAENSGIWLRLPLSLLE